MQPREAPAPATLEPQSFLDVIKLFEQHREALLRSHLYNDVHLVHFEPGRIELRPEPTAPRDLPNRLGQMLSQWTGQRWVVSVSGERGEPSLREQTESHSHDLKVEAAADPLVRAVLEAFPGARIETVREKTAEDGEEEAETGAEDLDEDGAFL